MAQGTVVRMASDDPFLLALTIQAMIIPLALGLALLAGVTPWQDLEPSAEALLLAVIGTMPIVLALAAFAHARAAWLEELSRLVRPTLTALFRGRGRGAVVVVAFMAGFSEELLFRGVLQAWLGGLIDIVLAIVVTSVAFGLLHCLSRAYFLYATALGLYLGAVYELTGSLLVVCLIHALYDWAAIWYVTSRAPEASR